MRFRTLSWCLALFASLSACKARTPTGATLKGEESEAPLDAMAAVEAQKVADACSSAKDSLFEGKGNGDEVEYVWRQKIAVTATTGNPEFFEKARFDGKAWKLSTPMVREFATQECGSRTRMTTNELISALGCADLPPETDTFCDLDATARKDPRESVGGFALADTQAEGRWSWGECNDPQVAYHLVARNSAGTMQCQGKIDTLYSWGSVERTAWLKGQPWNGRLVWKNRRWQVFTIQSAIATHGYGPVAIRFKLKDNVRWRYFNQDAGYTLCDRLSAEELNDTVVVRYLTPTPFTGVEMILCSMGPVASWSTGTEEHAREMERELAWVESHDFKSYELYVKQNGVDTIYPYGLDGHRFSRQELEQRIKTHRSQPAQIVKNPSLGTKPDADHFKTALANYIQLNGPVAATPAEPQNAAPAVDLGPVNTNLATLVGKFCTSRGTYIWADRGTFKIKWYDMNVTYDLQCSNLQGGQATCVGADPGRRQISLQFVHANQINMLLHAPGFLWSGMARAPN